MDAVSRRTTLFGALGLAVAGCSWQPPQPSTTAPAPAGPSAAATPTPTPPVDTRPRWPLTGRLVKEGADADHAAVAVKVPDNRNEHPQVGIDKADIVFVQLDGYRDASGYSGTRLMPVFHSSMPEGVAPVRSIRPVDIPLLSPMRAIIGNTGATGWVLNYVKHYGKYLEGMLSYMETKGTGSYTIDPSRVRTLSGVTYYDRAVVCHPAILAKQSKKFTQAPPEIYFPYAATQAEVSTVAGKLATTVSVPWKQGNTYNTGYTFDEKSGRYLRSVPWGKHVLADGKQVATDNVLVIRAKQSYEKIYKGGGSVEPVHGIIESTGSFYYANGGRYVTGTWTKEGVSDLFAFTLSDGSPLKMAPGKTFVELPQRNAKIVIKA